MLTNNYLLVNNKITRRYIFLITKGQIKIIVPYKFMEIDTGQ